MTYLEIKKDLTQIEFDVDEPIMYFLIRYTYKDGKQKQVFIEAEDFVMKNKEYHIYSYDIIEQHLKERHGHNVILNEVCPLTYDEYCNMTY